MYSDNQLVFYCEGDGDYRVYCDVCVKLCIERFYKSHLKTQSHTNNFRKRESLNKFFQTIQLLFIWIFFVMYVIDRLSKLNLNI